MKIFNCIPKQVLIGWQTYDIDFKEPCTDLICKADDSFISCGEIHHEKSLILLNETIDEDVMESTLLHEIVHGIDIFMNIGLDEDTVSKLAGGLSLFISQNQGLLK